MMGAAQPLWFVADKPPQATGHVAACAASLAQDHYLARLPNGLYALHDRRQRHPPLTIDFGAAHYRVRGGKEYLPKAFKGLSDAVIADVTAGWARDAWLLAYRGFHVTMIERNPYLAFLLAQGLVQAQHDPRLVTVAERLTLHTGDSKVLLKGAVGAVYLDPMYPERHKKAKVKKHMQALHILLGGEEDDADALLVQACSVAQQRVVVKRPQRAPYLNGQRPHHSVNAPNTRYDVYLCRP